MNKKLVVFASALIFGLFAFVSVDAIAKSTQDVGIEATANDCDNCGKADCKSCSAKKEGKGEEAAGTKKACCAGGGEGKSCSEKKSGKSETKTETKSEEKKK